MRLVRSLATSERLVYSKRLGSWWKNAVLREGARSPFPRRVVLTYSPHTFSDEEDVPPLTTSSILYLRQNAVSLGAGAGAVLGGNRGIVGVWLPGGVVVVPDTSSSRVDEAGAAPDAGVLVVHRAPPAGVAVTPSTTRPSSTPPNVEMLSAVASTTDESDGRDGGAGEGGGDGTDGYKLVTTREIEDGETLVLGTEALPAWFTTLLEEAEREAGGEL